MLGDKIKRLLPTGLTSLLKENDAYMVGGCVRDLLLDRTPADYDMVVGTEAEKFAHILSQKLGTRTIVLGHPDLPLYRISFAAKIFDISPLFGRHIKEDLQQRDFTVNAFVQLVGVN